MGSLVSGHMCVFYRLCNVCKCTNYNTVASSIAGAILETGIGNLVLYTKKVKS